MKSLPKKIVGRIKREAARKRKRKLVEANYRALAVKHHPDKGGSHEEMIRINANYNRWKKHECLRRFKIWQRA
jgi:hypothetical protein